jgi:DNA-binding CsgD family transcriptional regulator
MRVRSNVAVAHYQTLGADRESGKARQSEARHVITPNEGSGAPAFADHQANQILRQASLKPAHGRIGFVVTDLGMRPIYFNNAAVATLHYPNDLDPDAADNAAALQARLRSILDVGRIREGTLSTFFASGRRRYTCRSFLLESCDDRTRSAVVAIVLERQRHDPVELTELGRRFHLSQRESETVQHLIHGLTTKEVAQRMGVSPNTIKQFIRLIMIKMGVTTRSGIVGKLMGG